MKFGQIKTIIENNLSGSIKDKKIFKENIKNFKKHFLSDKNLSKLYVLYGDLSKPKSLTEENANIFLNEGISWAKSLLKKSKIPTIKNTINYNDYDSIDKLVYDTTNSLEEKINIKKVLINKLIQPIPITESSVNIPLSAMVKVVNGKINEYLNNLDEGSKQEVTLILKEDRKKLEEEFKQLKSDTEIKLTQLKESENNKEMLDKIDKTINKVNKNDFTLLNYYDIKKLNSSLTI
jgi:vacuolar-type H+-ATPase subunit I/STV1